ncbi:MAG: hypothetical protein ACREF5_02085 [Candidatus Saccharimonadales bacterium]
MAELYIYSFIAGLFAANGVPHFVKGITGSQHQTPFGRPSAAWVNVLWGWVNFAIAAGLLHYAHPWDHEYRAAGLFAIAFLLMALVLAYAWTLHPEYNKATKH